MEKFVVLLRFTEKGMAAIKESPKRAEAFKATAEKAGVKVHQLLWTAGPYDGILVLESHDAHAAAGIVVGLGRTGNVTTCLLPAYDAPAFAKVLDKVH